METFGGRLGETLKARGKSRRALLAEMKQKGVKGTTYPAINAYLNDETTPTFEFIDAVAEYLGVRPAWLAFGDGPRLKEPPQYEKDVGNVLGSMERLVRQWRHESWPPIPPSLHFQIIALAARLSRYHAAKAGDSARKLHIWSLGNLLGRRIKEFFDALGVRIHDLDPRERVNAVEAIVHAMNLAVPTSDTEFLHGFDEDLGAFERELHSSSQNPDEDEI